MMDRREVLRRLATGAALPFLARLAPDELLAFGRRVHADGGAGEGLRALDPHAHRTLVAACEGILPATDTPGATAAGVDRFIDRILVDWYAASERDEFLAGLQDLDARSRARDGRDFVDTSPTEQAATLSALDHEAFAAGGGAPWFGRLKFLTIWGYCTSDVGAAVLGESPMGQGRYEGCAPAGSSHGGGS